MSEPKEEEPGDRAAPAPLKKSRRPFRFEDAVHFSVYIVYLIYGVGVLYKARKRILADAGTSGQFRTGWQWLHEWRDDSNEEMAIFSSYMEQAIWFYLVHVLVSGLARLLWPGRHMLAVTVLSVAIVCFKMQSVSLLYLGTLFTSYYLMSKLERQRRMGTWLLGLVWMGVIFLMKESTDLYATLGFYEYYQLIIMISWGVLRCTSFNMHLVAKPLEAESPYLVAKYIGYVSYFPTMLCGPHMEYARYVVAWEKPPPEFASAPVLRQQLRSLAGNLLRAAFWWYFLQFALHYIYIHHMQMRGVEAIRLVEPKFGLHAVGYFMGLFFFLYYTVCYGVGIAFAAYDGMQPPRRPRCIGHVHYYSDMWKYFDEGLYEFLFKHIYCSLCRRDSGMLRKLLASALTFAFIFLWHGCYTYVLIWSILNFACLVAEKCLKAFLATRWYNAKVSRWLGPSGQRRLRALLASQIFIPSAFANVYFIGGLEVGNYLMANAYLNGFWSYVSLTFSCYCFFQTSEFIRENVKMD